MIVVTKERRGILFMDIDYRKNAFNLVRLIAALQVILEHSIIHFELNMPLIEKFNQCFRGVPLFFCMSGFLIAWSLERDSSIKTYFKKRVIRVYPEMWGGIVFSFITILLFYRKNIDVGKMILFLFTQATVLQFWTPDFLRGFGVGTPNGSLWSICNMVQFYIIIFFVYKKLKNFNTLKWGILFAISFGLNVSAYYLRGNIPVILEKLYEQTVFPYAYLYLIGVFVWTQKSKIIPVITKYFFFVLGGLIFVSVANIGINGVYIKPLKGILLCLFGIGLAYRFPKIQIKTDLSYGLYIYHMIFINVLVHLGYRNNVMLIFAVIAVSTLAAWISYHMSQMHFNKIIIRRH